MQLLTRLSRFSHVLGMANHPNFKYYKSVVQNHFRMMKLSGKHSWFCVMIPVSADALAPSDIRRSSDIVMTKFGSLYKDATCSGRSSRPGQNGCHFGDNIFNCIFMNEKLCTFIGISLKCVSKGPINSKSALVQVMAWCPTGNKPLPEPMMTQSTAYIPH